MKDVLAVIAYAQGGTFGNGHGVRMGHLAEALRDLGISVSMHNLADESGPDEIPVPKEKSVLIYDAPSPDIKMLRGAKRGGMKVAHVVGVGREVTPELLWLSDLVIYQTGWDAAKENRWAHSFSSLVLAEEPWTEILSGPDYLILDKVYADGPATKDVDVAMYFGGGITGDFSEATAKILIGRGLSVGAGPIPSTAMAEMMRRARYFVGTVGVSMYEALSVGAVPVLIARTEDHQISARKMGLRAPLASDVTPQDLVGRIGTDPPAPKVEIDGLGTWRVAKAVEEVLCR